jgi:hypothetical protein
MPDDKAFVLSSASSAFSFEIFLHTGFNSQHVMDAREPAMKEDLPFRLTTVALE